MNVLAVEVRVATQEDHPVIRSLRVRSDQERFVDPPELSLQGVAFYPGAEPLVVLAGDSVVGVMLCQPIADGTEFYLWDFLIDVAHQRRGLGRAAMAATIELLRGRGAQRICLAYIAGNIAARRLYTALGFVETGRRNQDGEIEMELSFAGLAPA